jgi:hypothetical protein
MLNETMKLSESLSYDVYKQRQLHTGISLCMDEYVISMYLL